MKAHIGAITLLASTFSSAVAQQAGTTDLKLSSAPTDNLFSVSLTALSTTDNDQTRISGNILATLNVDPTTGQSSEIIFTGGNLSATDMSFSLAFGFATATSTGLAGSLSTPVPPGTVTPATGEFPGSQHRLTFNQGTLNGSAPGQTFSEDFSQSNVDLDGSGTGVLTLTETTRSTTRIFYDVSLDMPIADTSTTDASGTSVDLTINGSIKASGSLFIFRSPYLEWTESNATAGASFSAEFAPGDWPNGLVWAMRSSRLPWTEATSSGNWSLALPAEGTLGELIVEQSSDLEGWVPADPDQVVGGNSTFPIGSTGSIELIPQDSLTFFRIRAVEP